MKSCLGLFANLSAAQQYLPTVAHLLLQFGWSRDEINGALDVSGAELCSQRLQERNFSLSADASVHVGARPASLLDITAIHWSQSHKTYAHVLDAPHAQGERRLRNDLRQSKRDLARLNGCSGIVSGKWLTAFPSSWWKVFPDDVFVMALRFRLRIPVAPAGLLCNHVQCKYKDAVRDVNLLDQWGDHPLLATLALTSQYGILL